MAGFLDPAAPGFFTGGAFTGGARDLSGYNALKMMVRANREVSIGTIGFGNDNTGSSLYDAALANVVVDVQCDYAKAELGNMRTGEAEMSALEATMRTIGAGASRR